MPLLWPKEHVLNATEAWWSDHFSWDLCSLPMYKISWRLTQVKFHSKVPRRCKSELSTTMLLSNNKLLKKYRDLCMYVGRHRTSTDTQEHKDIELNELWILCLYEGNYKRKSILALTYVFGIIRHSLQKLSSKVTKCPLEYLS